jgi:hypothetical protein
MVGIAQVNGMQLYGCCEEDELRIDGIRRSSCVDLQVLRKLTLNPDLSLRVKATRRRCRCVESVDIGSYDTCLYGCVYCYATHSRQAALQRYGVHDPQDSILFRPERLKRVDLDELVEAI